MLQLNRRNHTWLHVNKQPLKHTELCKTHKTQMYSSSEKDPDFHRVGMRQCCCDSRHAALASGPISCHNHLATAPGEGEHKKRISTLREENKGIWRQSAMHHHPFAAFLSCPPVPATQTSFQLWEIVKISVATSCASVEKKKKHRWRGNRLMWRGEGEGNKKCCRGKVPSMPYVVFLHPQSFPPQKHHQKNIKNKKSRKQVYLDFKWKTYCRGRGSGIPVGCIRAYH